MKKPVGKYSLGMRQRLGIAQAIMEDPSILILDEPFNGLDKHGAAQMRKLIKGLKEQGKTVTGGGTVSSFLVRFDFSLVSERFNGVYPVSIDVQAQATDGSLIQQTFTTYITITDGKDPNASEPIPKPEKPTSQPKVIVSGYSIKPGCRDGG